MFWFFWHRGELLQTQCALVGFLTFKLLYSLTRALVVQLGKASCVPLPHSEEESSPGENLLMVLQTLQVSIEINTKCLNWETEA